MLVINQEILQAAGKKHSDAKRPLQNWLDITLKAVWRSLVDVQASFGSVSYIPTGVYCFNIKGNSYRLLTAISFDLQAVTVLELLTQAEYDKRNLMTR